MEGTYYYKWLVWDGVIKKVVCKDHAYHWSGKMPCTGVRKCMFCGKLEDTDETTTRQSAQKSI